MDFHRYVYVLGRQPKTKYFTGRLSATPVTEVVYRGDRRKLAIAPECPVAAEGFSWGKGGAGSLALAFTLLREVAPEKRAIAGYKAFCKEVVEGLGYSWTITAKDLRSWIKTWEEEQAYLKAQEAAKPKLSAPRSLPFWGTMEPAIMGSGYKTIKEFVAQLPPDPSIHSAMLYLEFAINLAEARRKTVNSVYWEKADAQARTEIWMQLLMLEQQIGFNIERFAQQWDEFCDRIPADFKWPLPDGLMPEIQESEFFQRNYQRLRRGEVAYAIHYLSEFASKIRKRREQYQPFLQKHTNLLPP